MKDALMHPKHPERICWGCDLYCPHDDLRCRETRVPHPSEILGYNWDAPFIEIGSVTKAPPPASPETTK